MRKIDIIINLYIRPLLNKWWRKYSAPINFRAHGASFSRTVLSNSWIKASSVFIFILNVLINIIHGLLPATYCLDSSVRYGCLSSVNHTLDRKGQFMVEYGLLLVVIAVIVLVILGNGSIQNIFGSTVDKLIQRINN